MIKNPPLFETPQVWFQFVASGVAARQDLRAFSFI
jgi:hypothetical protein